MKDGDLRNLFCIVYAAVLVLGAGADLNVNGSVDPNDVRILAQSWLGLP